jgi:hypothetical protein
VNFVRYRPFVLGLVRVRIVGGHVQAMPLSTRTIGGRRGHIAPFAGSFERGNVGPACARQRHLVETMPYTR